MAFGRRGTSFNPPPQKKETLPKKHIFLCRSVLFSFQEHNAGFQIHLEAMNPIFRYGRAHGNFFFNFLLYFLTVKF